MESCFAQLGRSLSRSLHHVSKEYLPLYLGEFDYRYITKGPSEGDRWPS